MNVPNIDFVELYVISENEDISCKGMQSNPFLGKAVH